MSGFNIEDENSFTGTCPTCGQEYNGLFEWISVEDALPDVDDTVIAYNDCGEVGLASYDKRYEEAEFHSTSRWDMGRVTHWLPMPEFK